MKPRPLSAARIGAEPPHADALDAMTDKVLSYRPEPKSEPARARKRRAAKLARKKK